MTSEVEPATDEEIAEYRKLASLEMKRVLARVDAAERREQYQRARAAAFLAEWELHSVGVIGAVEALDTVARWPAEMPEGWGECTADEAARAAALPAKTTYPTGATRSADADELRYDHINHPPHYTHGGIEVIDAIEAWGLGFHLGNVVKYVARAGHKGDALSDLRKARWYLDREISRMEEEG